MNDEIFLVDTHCHLDLIELANNEVTIDQLVQQAKKAGVQHIVNVCVSIAEFKNVLAIAERYDSVSASVGLHPNEQSETISEDELLRLAQNKKVIAIGETGLDYYRCQEPLNWQRERFAMHIAVAKKIKKPLIVHTRAAKQDTIGLLQSEQASQVGGIMHCFTEDWQTAKAALDLGFYISFSGIVTFKNATTIQEVARKVPQDRILIETDAPYLAPDPYRGKTNEPAYVYYTAAYLAELRGTPFTEFAQQTTENFFTLFAGAVNV